jgi:Phage integrase family
LEPPSVLSPFAQGRRYLSWRDVLSPLRRALPLRRRSYGLMRRSCRLSSPSVVTSCEESLQVVTSPRCQRTFPTLAPQIFPQMPGPLPRRFHRVHLPVSSPVSSAFPKALYRSASRFTREHDFSADWFSRLQTFLYVQASEFACLPDRSYRCEFAGQLRLLLPGRACFVSSARTGYAIRPIQAIDGERTFTSLDSRPCRLLQGLAGPAAVGHIVRAALARAGVQRSRRGAAHLFRHSLATRMIRSGATLTEISEVLRHRSLSSTAIYAHVSFEALRAVAAPWPVTGGVQ